MRIHSRYMVNSCLYGRREGTEQWERGRLAQMPRGASLLLAPVPGRPQESSREMERRGSRGKGTAGSMLLGDKPSPAAWGNVVLSKCAHPMPLQGSALPGEWSPTVQEPPDGPQPPAAPMGSCWRGLKAPRVQGCWGPRSQCCQGAEPRDRQASGAAECVQLGSDARQRDSKS